MMKQDEGRLQTESLSKRKLVDPTNYCCCFLNNINKNPFTLYIYKFCFKKNLQKYCSFFFFFFFFFFCLFLLLLKNKTKQNKTKKKKKKKEKTNKQKHFYMVVSEKCDFVHFLPFSHCFNFFFLLLISRKVWNYKSVRYYGILTMEKSRKGYFNIICIHV